MCDKIQGPYQNAEWGFGENTAVVPFMYFYKNQGDLGLLEALLNSGGPEEGSGVSNFSAKVRPLKENEQKDLSVFPINENDPLRNRSVSFWGPVFLKVNPGFSFGDKELLGKSSDGRFELYENFNVAENQGEIGVISTYIRGLAQSKPLNYFSLPNSNNPIKQKFKEKLDRVISGLEEGLSFNFQKRTFYLVGKTEGVFETILDLEKIKKFETDFVISLGPVNSPESKIEIPFGAKFDRLVLLDTKTKEIFLGERIFIKLEDFPVN